VEDNHGKKSQPSNKARRKALSVQMSKAEPSNEEFDPGSG
jgi:hypothetical protein